MAALSGTRFSVFSDERRIFSGACGFPFLPGFSFVLFSGSCVLISVLFFSHHEKVNYCYSKEPFRSLLKAAIH